MYTKSSRYRSISSENICADGHSPIYELTPIWVLVRVKLLFWDFDNVADDPPLVFSQTWSEGGSSAVNLPDEEFYSSILESSRSELSNGTRDIKNGLLGSENQTFD